MNFEQRFYGGSRINNDGIFSTTDDEEDFKIHKIDINHSNSEKIDFYRSKDIEE